MARGWKSKAVADQIAAVEAAKATRAKPALSAGDLALADQKRGLELARAKVVNELQAARDERHRAVLRRALEYLDAQIDGVGV